MNANDCYTHAKKNSCTALLYVALIAGAHLLPATYPSPRELAGDRCTLIPGFVSVYAYCVAAPYHGIAGYRYLSWYMVYAFSP